MAQYQMMSSNRLHKTLRNAKQALRSLQGDHKDCDIFNPKRMVLHDELKLRNTFSKVTCDTLHAWMARLGWGSEHAWGTARRVRVLTTENRET